MPHAASLWFGYKLHSVSVCIVSSIRRSTSTSAIKSRWRRDGDTFTEYTLSLATVCVCLLCRELFSMIARSTQCVCVCVDRNHDTHVDDVALCRVISFSETPARALHVARCVYMSYACARDALKQLHNGPDLELYGVNAASECACACACGGLKGCFLARALAWRSCG